MNKKILIVEDQFVEANDIQLMLRKAGYEVSGIARSVAIAQEMIKKEKPGLVLLDIFLKGPATGIDLARQLRTDNIAFIYLSANSSEDILSLAKTTEPYGFIVKPFRERDLLITLEIAQYRHEHSLESRHRRETELIEQLEGIEDLKISRQEKLLHMGKIIQQEIPFDFLTIGLDDAINADSGISFLRIGFHEYQTIGINELSNMAGIGVTELLKWISKRDQASIRAFFNEEHFVKVGERYSLDKLSKEIFQMKSLLLFPLSLGNNEVLNYRFYSRRPDAYNADHIVLLQRLEQILLKNGKPVTEVNASPDAVEKTEQLVTDSTASTTGFQGIIGNSHLLLNVFDQIAQVAPFDTSVLILGESGTGKERIADCIHHRSPRKRKPFIKLNCTTLPATLIESELFGHEKGSFTGAIEKRAGKFEQANHGTIFLDEIGEMPIDLQVKLLRVLQEKEIEPIGGKSPVKVDVRVIAATNRDLEKEVAEGRFRLDLYYRLNVFPIELPSLRERREDIPLLANHFIAHFSHKAGKKIVGFSDEALAKMKSYSWPGNIRELENLIERAVLLAKGSIIEDIALPSDRKKDSPIQTPAITIKTIYENERDHILNVLKKCEGKIWGTGGAAEALDVPPSTLRSKMKKLNINKEDLDRQS